MLLVIIGASMNTADNPSATLQFDGWGVVVIEADMSEMQTRGRLSSFRIASLISSAARK